VIDPVMVSESGSVLLDTAARAALIELLLPLATVITPNVPEARVLADTAGLGLPADASPEDLARALHALGPDVVVVTGGHREEATECLYDGADLHLLPGERHPDGAAHGSGCTHSSSLAAQLALGHPPLEAARRARAIAAAAVRDGLRSIGTGPGPVDVLGITAGARHACTGASDVASPRV
jgi:hydroxymethylpyrimidine/phosphomethylpyrimidine kinase